jgi:hypothetical protein
VVQGFLPGLMQRYPFPGFPAAWPEDNENDPGLLPENLRDTVPLLLRRFGKTFQRNRPYPVLQSFTFNSPERDAGTDLNQFKMNQ